ncbi:cytochrome P450 [Mucor lusitanicus]|uniref:Cytochrome P450 n=1 Tax=Mucor circinelloides f. lusitanicus TaxID=29924 RepID=A0A8H4BR50_MUCCL|nr:cytochrome P450 [Mucor lusitanicus]
MEHITKFVQSIEVPERFKHDKAAPIVSIAAATTLLYASYRLISTSKRNKKKRELGLKDIPVPGSCYPYVGHMFSLGDLPGETISKWHRELGPILNIKMGCQTWISLTDPVLAHKVFVTHGANTSFRAYTTYSHEYYSFKGKGIAFSQPTTSWKKARSAALSVLAPKMIEKNYMQSIRKESSDFVNRLIHTTETKGSVDPLRYLELFTLNVIFNSGFGRRFDNVDDPEFRSLAHMVEYTMKLASLDNDLPNFLPALSIVDYFIGTQVKMKNFINNERNPVYSKLIKEAFHKEGPNVVKSLGENGFVLDDEEMLVFMSDLIAAGTDTISVTMSWNYAILCRYPDLQKRVSAEIDSFIKIHGRVPDFSEREELPLCISVMKESMRYRPTSPFGVSHTTDKDIIVDGYLIPKDCTIISNMGSMHTNAERYENPFEFIPERFMDNLKTMQASANGNIEQRDTYNFGWGRRICPGIYLAEVEIFYAFVQVFAKCFIEPVIPGDYPNIDDAKNAGLTVLPKDYQVKFTKRADAII